jgi:hypothetical protein
MFQVRNDSYIALGMFHDEDFLPIVSDKARPVSPTGLLRIFASVFCFLIVAFRSFFESIYFSVRPFRIGLACPSESLPLCFSVNVIVIIMEGCARVTGKSL